jgi:hypothetical protein
MVLFITTAVRTPDPINPKVGKINLMFVINVYVYTKYFLPLSNFDFFNKKFWEELIAYFP